MKPYLPKMRMQYCFLMILCSFLGFSPTDAQDMQVKGRVLDAQSGIPIPGAQVYWMQAGSGGLTDSLGVFSISGSDVQDDSLCISFLGFQSQCFPSLALRFSLLEVFLEEDSRNLNEVVVFATVFPEKDSQAIALQRQIVRAKGDNDQSNLQYYSYRAYTKAEFDIFNFNPEIVNRKFFKPLGFVSNYVDTSVCGRLYLPVLLRESMHQVYYRNVPRKEKSTLIADQFSGVRDYYKWQIAENILEEMNFYHNVILIQGKPFFSPFADHGPSSYKYTITDSLQKDGEWFTRMEFIPKRKGDLCFRGFAWIHNASGAIESLNVSFPQEINVNYIQHFYLVQEFDRVDGVHWFKVRDEVQAVLHVLRNDKLQQLRIKKAIGRSEIHLNRAIPDEWFKGEVEAIHPKAFERDEDYWNRHRTEALTKTESRVFEMIDSVQQVPAYRRFVWGAHLLESGYARTGPVEWGSVYQMFSFNALEGTRFRFGIRNHKFTFRERLELEGYGAYGTRDDLFKYHIGLKYHLPRKHNRWNQIGGFYRYDWSRNFGYNTNYVHDGLFQVLARRTPLDNLYLFRETHLFYEKEWVRGLMQRFSSSHKTIYAWPGSYSFLAPDGNPLIPGSNSFQTLELGTQVFWTIRSKRKKERRLHLPLNFRDPIMELTYNYSPSDFLGSNFSYHRLELGWRQRLHFTFGKTDYRFFAGKIFGTVPYPLLKVHPGNESLAFNKWSYNLMNEWEFGSDRWAAFWFQHRFRGLIMDRIPGVRKLQFRSLITGKILAGGLSQKNQAFLIDANGLGSLNGVYAELGVGIENIAKFFRVDFIWRLTQRDLPTTSGFGVRIEFRPRL